MTKQPGRTYGPAPKARAVRVASPLDQRDREDRYRRQTGRPNMCNDDQVDSLDYREPSYRAKLLGLTPKQRRRSEHKANRAEARMLAGVGRGR